MPESTAPAPFRDRLVGALLGSAVGDALGMPVEGLSHQNVRTYYKGIKEMRADEKRGDLDAGQWTADTQRARALTRALATAAPDSPEEVRTTLALPGDDARRGGVVSPSSALAACAAPLGVQARLRGLKDLASARWAALLLRDVDPSPVAHVAAAAQIAAVRTCLDKDPESLTGAQILDAALSAARDSERLLSADDRVSKRLDALRGHLGETPLDLQDLCNGTGSAADEAFPFAVAMVARSPELVEPTFLAAVNVGGDAAAVGACVGALVGALHGARALPAPWLDALEDADAIRAEAEALVTALGE
ncbi:ADP-ribosylglycohydrolase family protein [Rubrivirga sp. S365]|uniref:ADP-ribosylglycohydrolase family protein n=1 Tax=Rubrivirga litoralis TaxID=3075598 RepID=A0ABU3BVH3_9BACT|nr:MULTISPECIES: ADP-ribosylglycohydrolase family protein [unclassified Rubrivirga]MDT0633300.1 ADP-ribosylglycohydrolase family protein [Rubrivirga sp. F394]MDT7855119.1 ADP-ribosylglycohydrolase family protein [Rubrivirga sp. S365]